MELEDEFIEIEDPDFKPWGLDLNMYCTLMHLSQLLVFGIPLIGFIVPLIMWLNNRDHSRTIYKHGVIIVNWQISTFIYYIIAAMSWIVGMAQVLYFGISVCSLVFLIIGATKAYKKEYFHYPLSLKLIK